MNQVFLLSLLLMGISLIVSMVLKAKISTYSQLPLSSGLTGREVAAKMLQENSIYDVRIVSVEGQLTDHYNPTDKTVNLSPEVYAGNSIAAAAIAAHECGHAVQHARAYSWLSLRSNLVPIVQISSTLVQWVLLAGILLIKVFPLLLLLGIALFALTTLFSLITLPVEFDASRRALAWLEKTRLTLPREHDQAKDALKWAAMTYVVAAIAALATLIQYLFLYSNRNK